MLMRSRMPDADMIPRRTIRARLPIRVTLIAIAAAALLAELGLAAPAGAQGVIGTVPGRVGGSEAAVVALIGVVTGALALRSARRAGTGNGRDGAIVAL